MLALALATGLATTALAPTPDVLVVDSLGSGDYTILQDAIDAASDGDVLLIKQGGYGAAEIRLKGLSLIADGSPVTLNQGLLVIDTLVEHEVLLKGLSIQGQHPAGQAIVPALEIDFVRGPLRVEHCEIRGANGPSACDWTLFGDCAGGDAVRISVGLDMAFSHCHIQGGDGIPSLDGEDSNRGGDGLHMQGGSLALHDCILVGGTGPGFFFDLEEGGNGGDGIYAEDGLVPAQVIVAGSQSTGGQGGDGDLCICKGGDGGDGLHLVGALARGFVRDSSLLGMSAGCGGGSPQPGQGLRTEGGALSTDWLDPFPRLDGPIVLREQETGDLQLSAATGSVAILVGSTTPDFRLLPYLRCVSLLQGGIQSYQFLGSVPAGGLLQVPVTGPQLPPGMEAELFFFQAWVRTPGQRAQLSGTWSRVTLDSSL